MEMAICLFGFLRFTALARSHAAPRALSLVKLRSWDPPSPRKPEKPTHHNRTSTYFHTATNYILKLA